jgi:hypothetical protein
MDRRAFITVVGGRILAAPLAVEAQQAGKIWRIGVLTGLSPDAPRWTPFREGLREFGYVEGKNIAVEWRSSHGRTERFTDLADELVRLKVDVIVAPDNPAIAASTCRRWPSSSGLRATGTGPDRRVHLADGVAVGR